MLEQRRSNRARTIFGARAIFNNGLSVGCHVRDLSDTGARLSLERGAMVPDEFQLDIPVKNVTHKAKVRWREGGYIGVAFVNEAEQAILANPRVRIRELEAENAALRKRVAEMARRLDSYGDSERLAL